MPSMNGHNARNGSGGGKDYFRSLEDFAQTAEFREFLHREFPAGASELLDSKDRRHFLKIMGASMALAGLGLSGCRRWPKETLAPFANRPDGRVPGEPEYYATLMDRDGVASPLLVTAIDGRPVKIEGNPDHPASRGATDAFAQASILDLYDPDRSRGVMHNGAQSSWDGFAAEMESHFASLRQSNGRGLAVLAAPSSSDSVRDMKNRLLQACSGASWFEYQPLANDNEVRGTAMALGEAHRVHVDYAKAKVIVSLDADFLGTDRNMVANTRGYARSRRIDHGHMSRMYAFESALSLTGSNADQRVAVRSDDVGVIAAWLGARIMNDSSLSAIESSSRGQAVLTSETIAVLEHVLKDLGDHRGESVVVAGPRQSPEVHALACAINDALGNGGQTVTYSRSNAGAHGAGISQLVQQMAAGGVDTLVIIGGNPVYDAPADLDFGTQLSKVGTTIHLSDSVNETSARCQWHINQAHYLEAWGDGRSFDGTYGIQQPLIEPIFDGKSAIELLAFMSGDDLADGMAIVQRTFGEMTGGRSDGDRVWRKTLHDGMLSGTAKSLEAGRIGGGVAGQAASGIATSLEAAGAMEAVFAADASVSDGRFANNGWLQELPDPLTKITWDNAVIMSVADAKAKGLKAGDMVRVSGNGRSVDGPVFVLPGQAPGSVTLPLGYGRATVGRIGEASGFDFYPLRSSDALWACSSVTVEKIAGSYVLATTQDHHSIDVESLGGRGIQNRLNTLVRAGTLDEYNHDPAFASHRTHVVHSLSLWEEGFPFQQSGEPGASTQQWGMSIDLNKCTGCNACVVACQSENNIPIVGKDQVTRGREMHWLRIDRYFRFGKDGSGHYDPTKLAGVALQPVPCMHCENAPCESVCPVAATVHDDEGLNVMVYNRCIGTRYCSNNCPYKVRRFNYFDFHRRKPVRETGMAFTRPDYYTEEQASSNPLSEMVFNPEVTIRVRGVMEKCTYCVQRINSAKIKAKNDWVKQPTDERDSTMGRVPDGSIQTACQQACPAEAITFGDLTDANSEISRMYADSRTYEMLEELNVKARTKYMARIWNPAIEPPEGTYGGGHGHGGGHHDDHGHEADGEHSHANEGVEAGH